MAVIHATQELLDQVVADLTFLVQTPEVRYSKRNLNAFVDALKRADHVRAYDPELAEPDPEPTDALQEVFA